MSDTQDQSHQTPDQSPADDQTAQQPPESSFTQADVDRIVRERVKREREKYADYSDLKERAATAKTLEERIAELEQTATQAQVSALRAEVANAHGISAEDRDLFLTGSDEETLTKQARRLADRESERKKSGNYVPNEGRTPNETKTDEMREFTRQLFRKE